LDSREDQFLDEFFAEVLSVGQRTFRRIHLDVNGDSPNFECLFLGGFKVFFLPDIGHYTVKEII